MKEDRSLAVMILDGLLFLLWVLGTMSLTTLIASRAPLSVHEASVGSCLILLFGGQLYKSLERVIGWFRLEDYP